MNDDMFGLNNIFEDEEKGSHLATAIGIMIRLVLAITTGGFFYVYAGGIFSWLVGLDYSPWLTAVVGVFCIDYLAWHWSNLRENHATTDTQLSAAKVATLGNMGMSVLVTVIFFILQTDFVSTQNPDGTLNTLGMIVNILGLLVGTVAIAGNGAFWHYYQANGINSRRRMNNAQLRAAQLKGQFEVDTQQSRLVILNTMGDIRKQLPTLAASAGSNNADQFFRERFRDIDRNSDGHLTDEEIATWIQAHPEQAQQLAARMQEQPPARSDNGNEQVEYPGDVWNVTFTNRSGRPWSSNVITKDIEVAKRYARTLASEGNNDVRLLKDGEEVWHVPNGATRPR